jgi:hypothetical protein
MGVKTYGWTSGLNSVFFPRKSAGKTEKRNQQKQTNKLLLGKRRRGEKGKEFAAANYGHFIQSAAGWVGWPASQPVTRGK